jgi:phosphatidylserine decarboxylase
MDQPSTRNKIAPFIREYELDVSEFVCKVDDFANFNEFFFRKLKMEARPIDSNPASVVFPADGRHLCVPDLSRCDGLFVKGKMFDLNKLLDDKALAKQYAEGSLLLSRLCPIDYHRFHFTATGVPGPTRLINGPLYSVNPIALCQNIHILATNKRCITELQTEAFGKVLLVEIGATCVGNICQTYTVRMPLTVGSLRVCMLVHSFSL